MPAEEVNDTLFVGDSRLFYGEIKTMTKVGFHPNRSQVAPDTMAKFVTAPVTGMLKDVPGIGPAAITRLAMEDGGSVTNTYHLIGKFLSLCPNELDPVEHCDKFWHWLCAKGIRVQRSSIVLAVAEKANLSYPGVYDADLYDK